MAEETKKETQALTEKVENTEETAADADKAAEVKEEKEGIYDSDLPNRIIVGRNHPLSFYVDRAVECFVLKNKYIFKDVVIT